MSIFKKTSLLVRLLLFLTKFQKGLGFHFFFRSEASLSMYAHRAVLQCVFTELFTDLLVFFPNGCLVTSARFVQRSFLFAQGNKFLGDPGST